MKKVLEKKGVYMTNFKKMALLSIFVFGCHNSTGSSNKDSNRRASEKIENAFESDYINLYSFVNGLNSPSSYINSEGLTLFQFCLDKYPNKLFDLAKIFEDKYKKNFNNKMQEALNKKGKNTTSFVHNSSIPLDFLKKYKHLMNFWDKNGNGKNIMHFIAEDKNAKLGKYMLDQTYLLGMEKDSQNRNALDTAIESLNEGFALMLLEHSEYTDSKKINLKNTIDKSTILPNVLNKILEIVDITKEDSVDINELAKLIIVNKKPSQSLKFLFNKHKNKLSMWKILELSVRNNRLDILESISEEHLNFVDEKSGKTLFHLAAQYDKNGDIVTFVLSKIKDKVNQKDKKMRTPLFIAAVNKNEVAYNLLLPESDLTIVSGMPLISSIGQYEHPMRHFFNKKEMVGKYAAALIYSDMINTKYRVDIFNFYDDLCRYNVNIPDMSRTGETPLVRIYRDEERRLIVKYLLKKQIIIDSVPRNLCVVDMSEKDKNGKKVDSLISLSCKNEDWEILNECFDILEQYRDIKTAKGENLLSKIVKDIETININCDEKPMNMLSKIVNSIMSSNEEDLKIILFSKAIKLGFNINERVRNDGAGNGRFPHNPSYYIQNKDDTVRECLEKIIDEKDV